MKYIVKHNIPHLAHKETEFSEKDDALCLFRNFVNRCINAGYPVKSFIRDDGNKPLRATLKVEVDNFTYYVELFAQ